MNYKCDNCGTKFNITSSGKHQDKIDTEGLHSCPFCGDFTLEESKSEPKLKWMWDGGEGWVEK